MSSKPLEPAPIRGFVDGCARGRIAGWAVDNSRNAPVFIEISHDNGFRLGAGYAILPREDLNALAGPRPGIAFDIPLGPAPAPLTAGQAITVSADGTPLDTAHLPPLPALPRLALSLEADSLHGEIEDGATTVEIIDQDGRAIAPPASGDFTIILPDWCLQRPDNRFFARHADGRIMAAIDAPFGVRGFLDRIDATGCAGWLWCPAAPLRRLTITLHDGTREIARMRCDRLRPDLAQAQIGPPDIGFEIAFTLADAAVLTLSLADSPAPLLGSPFWLASAAALEAETSKLAQFGRGVSPGASAVLHAALEGFQTAPPMLRLPVLPPEPAPDPRGGALTVLVPVPPGAELTPADVTAALRAGRDSNDRIVFVAIDAEASTLPVAVLAAAGIPQVACLGSRGGFAGALLRGARYHSGGDILLLAPGVQLAAAGTGALAAAARGATGLVSPLIYAGAGLPDLSWPALADAASRLEGAFPAPAPDPRCLLIRRALVPLIGTDAEHHAAAALLALLRTRARLHGFGAALLPAAIAWSDEPGPAPASDLTAPARRLVDGLRLARLARSGRRMRLVIDNWLEGGTKRAIAEHEYEDADLVLTLRAEADGGLALGSEALRLRIAFDGDEIAALIAGLAALPIERVAIHHFLGFSMQAITAISAWAGSRATIWAHDYYMLCPRVTLLDAAGGYCGVGAAELCARCLAMAGPHEASRLRGLDIAAHRALFQQALRGAGRVLTPSASAALLLRGAMPGVSIAVMPHPARGLSPAAPREGDANQVILLGALADHKGARALVALARHAKLYYPARRFHLIGHSTEDAALRAIGNVSITGPYALENLPALIAAAGGRLALFLHGWPETFSYTLSEALAHGLIPVVPDIGAPAERLRAIGGGVIYPFPFTPASVLRALDEWAARRVALKQPISEHALDGEAEGDDGNARIVTANFE
jgi:hypothetical protein